MGLHNVKVVACIEEVSRPLVTFPTVLLDRFLRAMLASALYLPIHPCACPLA